MNKLLRDRRLLMVIIVVFVLVIAVFDQNNLIDRWRLSKRITDLEEKKQYYIERITEDSLLLENLADDRFLEQYAREHFLMKREGELIFILKK